MNIKKLSRKNYLLFLLALVLTIGTFSLTGCNDSNEQPGADGGEVGEPVELYISAAASLTDALIEIEQEYNKQSNAILTFNFAGSGTLQKQIEEGAPCDLFISASKGHMDALEELDIIDAESRTNLLGNTLVLIASSEKAQEINKLDYLKEGKPESICIGEPETVPAGKYAKEVLNSMGAWEALEDKIIYAKDVKQVIEYVDTGNVDCGFVYESDALLLKTGKIADYSPEGSHSPIVYPAALIKDSQNKEEAAAFYEFIKSDEIMKIFEKYGFTIL